MQSFHPSYPYMQIQVLGLYTLDKFLLPSLLFPVLSVFFSYKQLLVLLVSSTIAAPLFVVTHNCRILVRFLFLKIDQICRSPSTSSIALPTLLPPPNVAAPLSFEIWCAGFVDVILSNDEWWCHWIAIFVGYKMHQRKNSISQIQTTCLTQTRFLTSKRSLVES